MADKGFQCQLCQNSYEWLQSLNRHYRIAHNINPSTMTGSLKEQRKECPYCHQSFIRLDHHDCHLKPQISPPKGQRPAKQQKVIGAVSVPQQSASRAQPSTSGIQQSTSQAQLRMMNLSVSEHEPVASASPPSVQGTPDGHALISEILARFKHFMFSDVGKSCARNTAETYVLRIRAFLRFLVRRHGPDSPAKLIAVSWAEQGKYMSLPNPALFVQEEYPSEKLQTSSRQSAFNAFIKFCDYLLFELEEQMDNFQDQNDYQRRCNHILKQRKVASQMDVSLGKKKIVYREERLQEARTLEDMEHEVPDQVIEHILLAYQNCELRKETIEALGKKMKPFGKVTNEEQLRDFLMLELYIQGVGVRPDVLKNLTWYEMTIAEASDDGNYIVPVHNHKTAKTYGPMQLIIPKMLHFLIVEFCCEIYPENFKKQQKERKAIEPKDYVFVSNTGNQIERVDRLMELWLRFVPEAFGDWRPKPSDFRRFCETKYQTSDNQEVRDHAPASIGHSQKTAEKNYVMRSQKQQRQLVSKAVIIPNDPVYDTDQNAPENLSAQAAAVMQKQRQEARDAQRQKKQELAEASFSQTNRKFLMPSEHQVLRETFDPLGRESLLVEHIEDALRQRPEFAAVYAAIKKRGFDDKNTKAKIQSSYRALRRTENRKRSN